MVVCPSLYAVLSCVGGGALREANPSSKESYRMSYQLIKIPLSWPCAPDGATGTVHACLCYLLDKHFWEHRRRSIFYLHVNCTDVFNGPTRNQRKFTQWLRCRSVIKLISVHLFRRRLMHNVRISQNTRRKAHLAGELQCLMVPYLSLLVTSERFMSAEGLPVKWRRLLACTVTVPAYAIWLSAIFFRCAGTVGYCYAPLASPCQELSSNSYGLLLFPSSYYILIYLNIQLRCWGARQWKRRKKRKRKRGGVWCVYSSRSVWEAVKAVWAQSQVVYSACPSWRATTRMSEDGQQKGSTDATPTGQHMGPALHCL
jgi:hypothetical protein